MEKIIVTALFLAALALPVLLFLLLSKRSRLHGAVVAAIAVAAGWAFNLAYAYLVEELTVGNPSPTDGEILAIAAVFGWICPSALVLVTWLVQRLVGRRENPDDSTTPSQ